MNNDISSFSNPRIKNLIKLSTKRKEREGQGLIVVEGKGEIELAYQNNFKIKELFYSPDWAKQELKLSQKNFPVFTVNKKVFAKASYRENPDGFLALVASPKRSKLSKIKISSKPLIVVLEGVEKPGNLGAVLRTADIARVDAIIINQEKTDIYSPNVIRSSLGSVFCHQIVNSSIEETFSWLQSRNICTVATVVGSGKDYTKVDYCKGVALLMGEESNGLSDDWQKKADEKVTIPMMGQVNSLNVSVSAGIMIFEVLRQRKLP